jgi:hypothetical protein
VKIFAAEEPFQAGGHDFNAGTFVILSDGNPPDLRDRISAAAAQLGFTARGADAAPKVPMHLIAAPRSALVHTWQNTQNEGWYRIAFDTLHIPYSYISDHTVRDTPDLRQVGCHHFRTDGRQPAARGQRHSMRGAPIPWKKTDLTPNLGSSPDTTDDMRGGMGLQGLIHLRKFVEQGGLIITVGRTPPSRLILA